MSISGSTDCVLPDNGDAGDARTTHRAARRQIVATLSGSRTIRGSMLLPQHRLGAAKCPVPL